MDMRLNKLFNPENIAVVGASNNPQKAGFVIMKNLIKIGYPKRIFPININEDSVAGIKCYKQLSDIDDIIEMVVLITPADMIFDVMEDLDRRMTLKNDVKIIICAAADYGETKTAEGIRRQDCLMNTASKYGIRVVGPNCIGVIDNVNKVDTTFVETLLPSDAKEIKGGVSVISQSGAIAASLLMMGASKPAPIAFNKFISIGNMADVDFVDLLEYFEQDEETRVIGLYLEGYSDGRKLIDTMSRITPKKPIVVLKVGRSEEGASAANSHTGSLAGADAIYDSAFRQNGVIRVDTIDEMMDTLQAFDKLKLPENNKVFVLSQAGGPGIYCTDEVSAHDNLEMPIISDETKEKLKKITPPMSSICFPEGYADITASANVEQHVEALRAVMDDPNVGSVMFITVTPTFLSREKLAAGLIGLLDGEGYRNNKPALITIMAGNYVWECRRTIEEKGIYTFPLPDYGVKALSNMVQYSSYIKRKQEETR